MMGKVEKKRYWNKLNCTSKKKPNKHKVYSISIPEHIVKRTNWKGGDFIGFQLFENTEEKTYSIELRNLSKEKKPYADMFFIQMGEELKEFIKKITPKNMRNFSKDLQELFKARIKDTLRKQPKYTKSTKK